MSTQPKSPLTPEQYLEIERKAEYKSEYLAGEMFAMSGASREHNVLVWTLASILFEQLHDRQCELYPGDMRVLVAPTGLYTYPNIVGVCGIPRFRDGHADTLINPTFLAEILSPSTEAYDRGRKFEHYRQIESLQEYLLVAQDRMHADLFLRRSDSNWILAQADRPDDALRLRSLGCELPMARLYQKIDFPSATS